MTVLKLKKNGPNSYNFGKYKFTRGSAVPVESREDVEHLLETGLFTKDTSADTFLPTKSSSAGIVVKKKATADEPGKVPAQFGNKNEIQEWIEKNAPWIEVNLTAKKAVIEEELRTKFAAQPTAPVEDTSKLGAVTV